LGTPVRLLLVDLLSHGDLPVYVEAICGARLPVVVETADTRPQALEKGSDCSVLAILDPAIDQTLIDHMPQLEWIHALTSGTNRITSLKYARRPLITSSAGIHGPQMSELTLLHMLSAARGFPKMLTNAQSGSWQRWPQMMLAGRCVLILGVGKIAEALALRCRALEMHVVGMSGSRTEAPGFDRIVSPEHVAPEAAAADFVVVLLPYNAANHLFVNEAFLQTMKPGAILINVSRGMTVDEPALLRALHSGHLRHAGLDVFATEPLPADSPLWKDPGVTVTPHVGGMSDRYAQQALPVLLKNLSAFCGGRRADMINVVSD
jgi:D-2-hydroxyacid dehydrogenase (NADP+)